MLELFAGAGGAALGLEAAGFEHAGLVELNADACASLRASGLGPVVHADVRDLDAIEKAAPASPNLLWSSFPCQAFSQAGSRLGEEDERNGWPWTVDAIDRFKPQAFIGENVRGLLSFEYFEETILSDLSKRFKHVGFWLLNAADFGVPQHRRRVFVWGADRPLVPPTRTHGPGMFTKPWVSMGEALQLDGNQILSRPSPTVLANEVKGHTNPDVDRGRKTPVSRAADALYLATGRRRLTVQECAILQGFPPDHSFIGTKKSKYRQVGNAVPPKLAQVVAEAVFA